MGSLIARLHYVAELDPCSMILSLSSGTCERPLPEPLYIYIFTFNSSAYSSTLSSSCTLIHCFPYHFDFTSPQARVSTASIVPTVALFTDGLDAHWKRF